MHIPDGFLDTKTWITASAASGAAIVYAVKKVDSEFEEKDAPLMGVLAAFIFAAQMLNFPVAGGTSGHFVGSALATILLGPWKAILVMLSVVGVQALLFGDGGITALGANIFNMAVIGPIVAHIIYRSLKNFNIVAAAFSAGLISIITAALACALELAVSGTTPLLIAGPVMAGWHTLIGIGEGLITATTVGYLLKVRPDLVKENAALGFRGAAVFTGIAIFAALFLSPLASSFPDGLERIAHNLGFIDKEVGSFNALIPDYAFPRPVSEGLATSIAGIIGVFVTIAVAFVVGSLIKRRSNNGIRS